MVIFCQEDLLRKAAFLKSFTVDGFGDAGLRVFGYALDSSFRKSRIANFKTKEVERALPIRQEVEARTQQAELHARALVRAKREEGGWSQPRWRDGRNRLLLSFNVSKMLRSLLAIPRVPALKKESRDYGSLEVSEDTVEAGADENTEGGEKAQGVNEEVTSLQCGR
ncbi:hypothetical protein Bca52824_023716 [Brassica carinata]|uniref:Uncharacterized protein n=1 Tax=Brassica carinata TaxID=52824 RepID=A0A8X8ASX6_BRACI|nr:hypothetical protein Bca52824_023716 [Brassica carinata]